QGVELVGGVDGLLRDALRELRARILGAGEGQEGQAHEEGAGDLHRRPPYRERLWFGSGSRPTRAASSGTVLTRASRGGLKTAAFFVGAQSGRRKSATEGISSRTGMGLPE